MYLAFTFSLIPLSLSHTHSARFIRPLSQRTAFSGIWLIFLFVYKYTADTTFNLLKCVQLEGNEVDQRYPLKLVRKYIPYNYMF